MLFLKSHHAAFVSVYLICFLLDPFRFLSVAGDIHQLLNFTLYILVAIFGIWLFQDDLKDSYSKFKQHIWRSLGILLLSTILVFVGQILATLLMGILYQVFELAKEKGINQASVEQLLQGRRLIVLAVFSIALTGPLVEELVFRKSLIDMGKKRLRLFIILQALLFAGIHMHALQVSEFISVIPQLITAFTFGVIYAKSKQILYPIIVHILFNTLAIIFLLI